MLLAAIENGFLKMARPRNGRRWKRMRRPAHCVRKRFAPGSRLAPQRKSCVITRIVLRCGYELSGSWLKRWRERHSAEKCGIGFRTCRNFRWDGKPRWPELLL